MTLPVPSSVEFAEFIANVSHPGTGEIRSDRLAQWLGIEEEELIASWRASDCPEWRLFAAHILEILDAFQDLSLSLTRSIAWYRELPLKKEEGLPVSDYVRRGDVASAVAQVRRLRRAACCSPIMTVATDQWLTI